ncbi:leucyl aminopeptidase family protein [Candidatus Poribacteria bacterium]|nr:leucyl aminopeptidase family protein [Candidatus Poribacteria bacterium]
MKFTVSSKSLSSVRGDALVILHTPDGFLARPDEAALLRHVEAYERALKKGTCKAEWFCALDKADGAKTPHLLIDSATFGNWLPGDEKLKAAAARAAANCRRHSLTRLVFAVDGENAPALSAALLEGVGLGDFLDTRFKSGGEKREALHLEFVVEKQHTGAVRKALEERAAMLRGVTLARELVNAPHNVLTPEAFADEARRVARKHRLKCEVLDAKRLKREGHLLHYNVGRGSEYPPCLIILRYTPPKKARVRQHLVLIGKGMTFDSGGYCLKPKTNIFEMNADMGGGAAVLGAMQAIAELRLPVKVTVMIPCAHNAVDGAAYNPGVILRSRSGKTVYVENTDAEGRLILADTLDRAADEKPDVIVDLATLTGAISIALGDHVAGLFTDDAGLRQDFVAASERSGDSIWPMPLWREYDATLKHDLADLNNMSTLKPKGGAIHGANFLKAFVPEGCRWAHLDIAGPADMARYRYYAPGGTGFGVRLLVDAAAEWARRGSI